MKRVIQPIQNLWKIFWDKKEINLFHPSSPGVTVVVERNRFQRLIRSSDFATTNEVLKPSRYKVKWKILHPSTGDLIECRSFKDGMNRWFEGFNPPRKEINGIMESLQDSITRVRISERRKKSKP